MGSCSSADGGNGVCWHCRDKRPDVADEGSGDCPAKRDADPILGDVANSKSKKY